MPSTLATRLLEAPRAADGVSDAIWRNSDITTASFVACLPSDQLTRELTMLYTEGEAAESIGKHLPAKGSIDIAVSFGSAAMRKGIARNSMATRAQLVELASRHGVTEAQKRLDLLDTRLTQAKSGVLSAAVDTITDGDITGVGEIFESCPELVLTALTQVDRHTVMGKLSGLDRQTHDSIALAWTAQDSIPIDTYLARWLTASKVRAETLLGTMTAQQVSRRCTNGARGILAGAGILQRKETPQGPASVPLDQMAAIMSPAELAGMYVGSTSPVTEALEQRILESAPASTLVNFLLGATLRKPGREQALNLIRQSGQAQRDAWAADLAARNIDSELLASGGTSVAVALLTRGESLPALPREAVLEMAKVIDDQLGSNVAAWEFLLVLSEEWEGTLIGLLDTAVAMETAPAQ